MTRHSDAELLRQIKHKRGQVGSLDGLLRTARGELMQLYSTLARQRAEALGYTFGAIVQSIPGAGNITPGTEVVVDVHLRPEGDLKNLVIVTRRISSKGALLRRTNNRTRIQVAPTGATFTGDLNGAKPW